MNKPDDKVQECDICGERYHGEDIHKYMKATESDGEVMIVCAHHLAGVQ